MAEQKKNIRSLGGGKLRIELAETKAVAKHEEEIEIVLSIVGHPEALVTDESMLSDFPIDGKALARIKKASGKAFGRHSKVIAVAEAIRRHKKGKPEGKRRKTDERE